jgi:protein-S-isoprenylcysteine O-methyltransferase Ste14
MSPWSLVVDVCWALVGIVWVAGAAYNARRAPAGRRRRGAWSALLAFALAWVVLRAVPHRDWESLGFHSWALRGPGLALVVVSTSFTLWARVVLGTMWSSTAVTREEHELRTTGPYAVTRHPIYSGLLGMMLGTALALGLGRWLALFALATLVIAAKIRVEERLLADAFGDAYEVYRSSVPQLIPGLRWRRGVSSRARGDR